MRPISTFIALAALFFASAAWADCFSTCNRNLGSCAQRCGTNARCFGTCQKQSDSCMGVCQSRGETIEFEKHGRGGRCTGPKGKSIPCMEQKMLTPAQNAKIMAQENAATEAQERSRPAEKVTEAEMQEFKELGILK